MSRPLHNTEIKHITEKRLNNMRDRLTNMATIIEEYEQGQRSFDDFEAEMAKGGWAINAYTAEIKDANNRRI
ncbi:MAG: hypothetical protein GY757_19000 [bacterium]|nr:hypothetical protein [bacterium]